MLFIRLGRSMITKLMYYILFLIISFIPSETVHVSGEITSCYQKQNTIDSEECSIISCLSEKMNELVAYVSSDKKEKLTEYDVNKPYAVDKKGRYPTPFFLDMLVRTTDWFSNIKVSLSYWPDFKSQKEIYQYKVRFLPLMPESIYIPPLKYYVYTLAKIIT